VERSIRVNQTRRYPRAAPPSSIQSGIGFANATRVVTCRPYLSDQSAPAAT